jgi:hypothetical protein
VWRKSCLHLYRPLVGRLPISRLRFAALCCKLPDNSRYYSIPLVVGRRIAQIVFFDTDGTLNERSYTTAGKYQTTDDLKKIMVCRALLFVVLRREYADASVMGWDVAI